MARSCCAYSRTDALMTRHPRTGYMLTLRPTGLSSPAYRDWLDYVIVEDGRDVGRVYEDRHSRLELRWFWAISIYINPKLGITTSGRAEPERGQGAIPGQLAEEVPRGFDSCPAVFYLGRHVEFALVFPANGLCRAVSSNPRPVCAVRRDLAARNQMGWRPGDRPEGGGAGSSL